MELSKMTAMEAKLDAIMHRMDKQERKLHTTHEIEAVERELMRRSAEGPGGGALTKKGAFFLRGPTPWPTPTRGGPTHRL